jgi:NlpC/P60 family putative phage cell wall peptidase
VNADPKRVIAIARSWLGTPYHDQASLRGIGCDCLGLARGVWREVVGPEPFPIPPYSRDLGLVAEGISSSGRLKADKRGLTGQRCWPRARDA